MAKIRLAASIRKLRSPFRLSLTGAAKAGVAAIEIEAAGELSPSALGSTARREVRHLLRSHGLEFSALYCPLRQGLDLNEDLEPRLESLFQAMNMAFELGPRMIIVPAGEIPKENDPRRQTFREAATALGQYGDRMGCKIAFDLVAAASEIEKFFGEIDSGSLAISVNPASFLIDGLNAIEESRTMRRRVAHFYAADARAVTPNRRSPVPLGAGDIDWMLMVATLAELEYSGYLTIAEPDSAEEINRSAAFLRRIVM